MEFERNQRRGSPVSEAVVARKRATDARGRALAARRAAEQATTESARRAHERVAAIQSELALSHEDFARTLDRAGDAEGA